MQKKKVSFTLPFPPSINNYYKSWVGKKLAVKNGKAYYKDIVKFARKTKTKNYIDSCIFEIYQQKVPKFHGKVKMLREFYPPDDKKIRDEDNHVKAINDAIKKAKIIPDDCWKYLRKATNVFHSPQSIGFVKITLEEI